MQFLFYDPSLNLTCQVWYKYKLHLVTLSNTTTQTGLYGPSGKPWQVTILGQLRPLNTHFWAIRLTKLLLGHCGSFKVIVIGQFV